MTQEGYESFPYLYLIVGMYNGSHTRYLYKYVCVTQMTPTSQGVSRKKLVTF